MSIRIFRKAMGLLLVDIIAIIGIFVLQFRTDSNIIEKLGNLQVTLSKKESTEEVVTPDADEIPLQLMNKFIVSYNGVNLYSDEKNPVIVTDNESNSHELTLESWEKVDDLSCVLKFSDGINVSFELASAEPDASLAIITDFPENFTEISIPYSFASNMKVEKEDSNSIILNKRKDIWEVSASSLADGVMNIKSNNFVATYSVYEEVKEFTFDSVISLPIADMAVFEENLETFSNNLIAAFEANTVESNITEQVAVSYVAAQAEKLRYNMALDRVPASVKKSPNRTYLSAPYFNTLESVNKTLDAAIASYEQKISSSAASGSLDIFTVHDIANFMAIHSNPSVVKKLLEQAASADAYTLPLAQATGIIQVFVDLQELRPEYASILYPVMNDCINRIAKACVYDGNVLTISENDTFLSVIQAIETGIAVMRYGLTIGDDTLQRAGAVIVNSYLEESASFDLRTLANLYPLLAFNKNYYPHFEKIAMFGDKMFWAWTCAKDIDFAKDSDGSITVTIDYPESYTHYVIFKGLPRFKHIYIYNMQFRTDPRFETYNSSGYVYKDKGQTLLLKSRHKKQFEEIRFEYEQKKPKVVTEENVAKKEEKADVKPESSGETEKAKTE